MLHLFSKESSLQSWMTKFKVPSEYRFDMQKVEDTRLILLSDGMRNKTPPSLFFIEEFYKERKEDFSIKKFGCKESLTRHLQQMGWDFPTFEKKTHIVIALSSALTDDITDLCDSICNLFKNNIDKLTMDFVSIEETTEDKKLFDLNILTFPLQEVADKIRFFPSYDEYIKYSNFNHSSLNYGPGTYCAEVLLDPKSFLSAPLTLGGHFYTNELKIKERENPFLFCMRIAKDVSFLAYKALASFVSFFRGSSV
jgi:hypothetical protein